MWCKGGGGWRRGGAKQPVGTKSSDAAWAPPGEPIWTLSRATDKTKTMQWLYVLLAQLQIKSTSEMRYGRVLLVNVNSLLDMLSIKKNHKK